MATYIFIDEHVQRKGI